MTKFVLFGLWGLLVTLFFFLLFKGKKSRQQERWIRKQLPIADANERQQLQDKLEQLLTQKSSGQSRVFYTLLFAAAIIPASLVLNAGIGNHQPLDTVATANTTNDSEQAPDLQTAINNLKTKLEQNPNDLEGQMLYARSMIRLQRFSEAVAAMEKAYELAPDNAIVVTDLAEALAYQSGTGNFLGRPETLLQRALEIDPNHQKALWLQGINYFEKQQFDEANTLWSRLLPMVQSDNVRTMLTAQINEARSQLGLPLLAAEGDGGAIVPLYTAVVTVDEAFKAQMNSQQATLFVFARQSDGPPMPIAARRFDPPFDFPLQLTLSDVHSLNQNVKLSSVENISLSAKVSFSGSATPADGDIISESVPVSANTDEAIRLHIDHIRS